MYGKSMRQETSDVDLSRATSELMVRKVEQQDGEQDPSVHPWGGLSTTKDDILTLLDCFIEAKPLTVLQNVFDNALARERERKTRYPDACSAGGRGYGTREMCALHTARPSCDTLENFLSPLGEETRSSLLLMREEYFIEKLTHRFNRKKFCRDCRKNVIREFKELKEPKRMRRERHCNCWFCVDNGFQCEVFEDGIIVDWSQCLSEADGSFHHFEWAVGTHEGESDIFGFEDVGMNARVHKTGINLLQFENYYITLRTCRPDGRCTEYCVKAHVLKGKSCVHLQHTLVVGDGFVTITNGESMKSFFERAEKVEEEDEDSSMNRDGNDLDIDGSHTQKHAKTPELAREFLLDAASVIFKEQIVKAFRDGTAQQNAKTVFVSLALKLLEDRVHVACKELITLENQNKLLEEEAKELREEQERRMKRKMKEREKKHRQKQKLKEKGVKLVESKSPYDIPSLNNSSTSTNHEWTGTPCSRDSANAEIVDLCSTDGVIDQSSCQENSAEHSNEVTELSAMGSHDCWRTSEQIDSQEEPGKIVDSRWQSIERKRRSARSCSSIVPKGGQTGNAQKITIPKQVWQPLDARKKTGLYSTDNAPGSVGNVNPLKFIDWDANGYQKLRTRCDEPVPLAFENSSNIYKSRIDRACECDERGQAASSDRTHMMIKQDCYSTHDESFWHDENRMTNSDSSVSLSSFLGEGDRESTSSSVTISSEQNPESLSFDGPEGCLNRIDSKLDTPALRTASGSLLETCARRGSENTDQKLHGRLIMTDLDSTRLARVSSCISKACIYLLICQQQCGFTATVGLLEQIEISRMLIVRSANFKSVPPSPPCRTGAKQIADHPHRDMNLERHPFHKLKPLGKKDPPEHNGKTQDPTDASFSLFQFSLPIASPVPPSSEDYKNGDFAGRMPLAQVQAQLCSKELTDVKEYELFSTKDSGIFSFMQIK
ncbi:hypothetical protein PR202_ga20510 [Eleusine coracana subsp. coracana]|uniref:Uncharacterized protein n=1 Tax=Eleusine coracana subsp. coracana TaxID=191504 RepID=A0AAV5CY26_ELECO|nr:hypothetical protein PR202_ga20510 [Eleusine coracana subsp. coracana]